MPEMIDLTPTWSALMPFMLSVLEDPAASEKAKAGLREELKKLAAFADKVNAATKVQKESA